MVEARVELSVAHHPEGSLYRRIVEQATRENMTPLEVIYLFAKERGGEKIYMAHPAHFHAPVKG